MVDDPERLAEAIGRVLPTAIAQATGDARLGHVLAPAMEKRDESSIRSDPHTLVNILYPLILPAIRKSIGETIDATFQSLNQSLKYSLTWRGLRWRWEAWRTRTSFAEVVLKHTLVFQVEHVFLIHRHTGLLISHVAAENAASQDPQIVSSMLVAIQDFVRDSFSGAEQQGLDTLRSANPGCDKAGPCATLVAFGEALLAAHEGRNAANTYLAFAAICPNGEGEQNRAAQILFQLVALKQRAPPRFGTGLRRLIVLGWLTVLLMFAGAWGVRWWQEQQIRESDSETQPVIAITDALVATAKSHYRVLSLSARWTRKALAKWDESGVMLTSPTGGLSRAPSGDRSAKKRLQASLAPPPGVILAMSATASWRFRRNGKYICGAGIGAVPLARPPRLRRRTNPGVRWQSTLPFATRLQNVRRMVEPLRQVLGEGLRKKSISAPTCCCRRWTGRDPRSARRRYQRAVRFPLVLPVIIRWTLTGHSDASGQGTFNLSMSLARSRRSAHS